MRGVPATVRDGTTQGSAKVAVNCTVRAIKGGFDVALNASLTGFGSVTISSKPGQAAVDGTTGGTGISATFEALDKGRFSADDCTISFAYDGAPIAGAVAIGSGHIWGHLSCPDVRKTDILVMGPDGGVTYATCDAETDFLFENCGQ
jgi:hypothetical protein